MMRHAQSGRMEEQRCSLQPSRSTPATPIHHGMALNNVPIGQKNMQGTKGQTCAYCLLSVKNN